ncbi:MAG: hypothetical protein LBQ64_01010 [Bacteroidales bacterium]|jgi:hypothetical protein|nr:hypothetical protein [Bacteroidales bacterium]
MVNKNVNIYRSRATGWWHWDVFCDEEKIAEGNTNSKREARRQARAVDCYTPPIIKIAPPEISAIVGDGHLQSFKMFCPYMEEDKEHSVPEEMSENTAFWVFGLDCFDIKLSEQYELVSAMLKVWGVYKGGDSADTVKSLHNLSDQNFDIIAAKTWKTITINISEDESSLSWNITL